MVVLMLFNLLQIKVSSYSVVGSVFLKVFLATHEARLSEADCSGVQLPAALKAPLCPAANNCGLCISVHWSGIFLSQLIISPLLLRSQVF